MRMSRRAFTFPAKTRSGSIGEERVNTAGERSLDGSGRRRYNWCPTCRELWGAAWMVQVGVQTCPACDGPVFAYVGRSPYDHDARTELTPWPILEGTEGGVHFHG